MPALLTQHGKLKFTMISGADSSRFIYVPGLVPTRQSENVSGIGMSASSRLQGHLAGVQPRLIQGVRSGDSVGEDQDTIASIRY